jgi:hypothetical protein
MCLNEVLKPIAELLFGEPPKAPELPAIPPLPEPPDANAASDEASIEAKKRWAARASQGRVSTNPTGGLGVLGQAQVSKPTLLGG